MSQKWIGLLAFLLCGAAVVAPLIALTPPAATQAASSARPNCHLTAHTHRTAPLTLTNMLFLPYIPQQTCQDRTGRVEVPAFGTKNARLSRIAALTPDDIWATTGRDIFHWDGTQWAFQYPTSNTGENLASGGYIDMISDGSGVLILNGDGKSIVRGSQAGWQLVSPGLDDYESLHSLATASATDAWAFGTRLSFGGAPSSSPLIMHWDGHRWSEPGHYEFIRHVRELSDVATSDSKVWAVGNRHDGIGLDPPPEARIIHLDHGTWVVDTLPDLGANTHALRAIEAVASDDVWAIGWINAERETLILHWDGAHWIRVPSPNPGQRLNRLDRIAAASATDIWAIGTYRHTDGAASLPLILHWDGRAWTAMAGPSIPAQHSFSDLATLPNQTVWLVGSEQTSPYANEPLAVYRDGSNWLRSTLPELTSYNNRIFDIQTMDDHTLWAIGDFFDPAFGNALLVQRLNSRGWTPLSIPNPQSRDYHLTGIDGTSDTDVWVIGTYKQSDDHNAMLHWDGSRWSETVSDAGGDGGLDDIVALAPDDVWAVGTYGEERYAIDIRHWDGVSWTRLGGPVASQGGGLSGIDAISPKDIWAVGTDLLHWDGEQWTSKANFLGGRPSGYLYSVAALDSSHVWAVGFESINRQQQIFAIFWNGVHWTRLPTPNLDVYVSVFRDVVAVSPTEVWASGFVQTERNQPYTALLMRWDGQAWQRVSSSAEGEEEIFYSIAKLDRDVWTAGYSREFMNGRYSTFPLLERFTWMCFPFANPQP